MAKSTRGGKYGSVNNVGSIGEAGGSGSASISKFDRAGFKSTGNGVWELDVSGIGGGQILDESDSYRYGSGPAYSITAWDKDYNVIGNSDTVYGSLNDAKEEIKRRVRNAQ